MMPPPHLLRRRVRSRRSRCVCVRGDLPCCVWGGGNLACCVCVGGTSHAVCVGEPPMLCAGGASHAVWGGASHAVSYLLCGGRASHAGCFSADFALPCSPPHFPLPYPALSPVGLQPCPLQPCPVLMPPALLSCGPAAVPPAAMTCVDAPAAPAAPATCWPPRSGCGIPPDRHPRPGGRAGGSSSTCRTCHTGQL